MSGWDEGAVYYSDQAQFPHGGAGIDPEQAASRHTVLRKFKEFIRNFARQNEPNVFPYRESLIQNPKFLLVNLSDLLTYDKDQDLRDLLRKNPSDYLPLFETAAAEVNANLKSRVAGETGEMEEPHAGEVQILLKSDENSVSMRSLGAQYISKLVKISGITIAASRTKAKATYVTLLCKNCKNVKVVPCRPGLGGAIVPRSCDHVALVGETPCPIDPWIVVPDRSKYVDQQTLKLQENPEDVPTGELPRNILLSVDRHLVQTIVPGTRLTIMGIYSIFQAAKSFTSHKGAVAVRQPYIRVVGIEETNEATRGPANFSTEDVEEFKKFASEQNVYENICSKIAPSIYGHDNVKKAVACLLFGGSRKTLPDGVKLRGDINVLLLGDPSTAKSQFLKFVEKTAPVAVYTSGKGSSAAGLTASVIRDNSTREFYLEGGAMVLADGGVVCIDEFDKMRPEDRVAIHEAMEQQTISIAKAGITTVLNSRTLAVGMTEIQGRGRAMVALRPLKGGEIVLRDSPIVLYSALPFHSDDHRNKNTYCSNCFISISQKSQNVSCSTCGSRFCTIDCQSAASTTSHTLWTCQTLIRLRQYFSGNRLPLDVQIQVRFLVSAYNLALISQSKFQTLLSLQGSVLSGTGADSDSDSSATFIHSLVSSVFSPLPVELGFSFELTRVLLAKDKLNAFGLMEPFSEQSEGRSVRAYGIYPIASFFNHDCLPNACRFDYLDAAKPSASNNTEIIIRMIHDVPQGREVCLSYFPVNLKYSERQKRLSDDYSFVCDCDRCKVEAGWSESEDDGLAMDDDEGNEESTMDEDADEQMEGEDGDVMKGDDDFPHAYFFLNYMCDRTNCWGTLAPLPPSVAATTGVMECNVCGNFKNFVQV